MVRVFVVAPGLRFSYFLQVEVREGQTAFLKTVMTIVMAVIPPVPQQPLCEDVAVRTAPPLRGGGG